MPKKTTTGKAQGKAKARKGGAKAESGAGFTAEEREAMRERARELKAAGRGKADAADGEAEVLAKLAEMGPEDRALGEGLHALIRATAPELAPRTWYGMPAYAKNGQIVCFFQNAGKFKARYSMLGFSDKARLDEGSMWPTSYAVTALGPAEKARIAELVRRAVS